MKTIDLREVSAVDPHLHTLIGELDTYLYNLYPPEEVFRVDLDAPTRDEVTFVVAYINGAPAACGAIKPLDKESVELKRLYVKPAYRNRGLAAAILEYLESVALAQGCLTIKL